MNIFLFLNESLIFLSFRKISDDIVTADQRRENIGRKVMTHASMVMRMRNSWFIFYMRPQKVQ